MTFIAAITFSCSHAGKHKDEATLKAATHISSMQIRPDGQRDVVCADGSTEVVTEHDLALNNVCPMRDFLNTIQVGAGMLHTCAVGVTGMKCWGVNDFGVSEVPADLKNPTLASAGAYHTCAIGDDGVRC